jgi:hypothetical protein
VSPEVVLAVVAGVVVVAAVYRYAILMVGRVAEELGEEPARWQLMMLPFGLFGPAVARIMLTRRNGGGRGGFA